MFTATPKDGAVWVTGASEGIGKATALKLAEEGFTVYISARSSDKLSRMREECSGEGVLIPLPLDVTDRAANAHAVEKIIKEEGRLALVIFNAGSFKPASGEDLNYEGFDFTNNVNLDGVINGLVPAVDAMKKAGQGQVAIVSSVAGYGGLPKNTSYGLTKAALINAAESLKFDFDRMNIKIQVINPGFIDTPLTRKNDFPMPFLMSVEDAAQRICDGLKTNKFEVTFPRRFTYMLKFINLLPYNLYFWVVKKMTGST